MYKTHLITKLISLFAVNNLRIGKVIQTSVSYLPKVSYYLSPQNIIYGV